MFYRTVFANVGDDKVIWINKAERIINVFFILCSFNCNCIFYFKFPTIYLFMHMNFRVY